MNRYLAQRLAEYAASARHERAIADFVGLSRELSGTSGGNGWTREGVYDAATDADR